MAVALREVNRGEWKKAFSLSVYPDQRLFVSMYLPPVLTAFLKKIIWRRAPLPLAVYSDNQLIGFLLLTKHDAHQGWIDHFFIDKRYQGRGYGKDALRAVIEIAVQRLYCKSLYLRVDARNQDGRRFYKNAGFVDTGKKMGGQLVYYLALA